MARNKKEKPVARSVSEIPGRQLTCRTHHAWPSEDMVDGRPLPRGVWCELYDPATNLWRLNDQCPRCGCIRYQDMPDQVYRNLPWKRKYSGEWVKSVERITSRDALQENIDRNMHKLIPSVPS